MSLKLRDAFETTGYINSVIANGTRKLTAGGSFSGTGEISTNAFSTYKGFKYLVGRDRLYAIARVSGIGDTASGILKLDPFFLATTTPNTDFNTKRNPVVAPFRLWAGQYNPANGTQYLYTAASQTSTVFKVDPDSIQFGNVAAFTGVNGDFWFASSNTATNVEGYYQTLHYTCGQFFEGLTDGIPGETVLTGTNVYPGGLLLVSGDSRLGGVNKTEGWVWVHPNTRRAVGRLGGLPSLGGPTAFPAKVTDNPISTDDQTEQPIGEDTFLWGVQQYIPDPDATFAIPKGLLLFSNTDETPTGPTVDGEAMHVYLRMTDFNPFNVASASGIPPRTHGRIRFTSRANVVLEPAFGVAGRHGGTVNDLSIAFDSPRQRFLMGLEKLPVGGPLGSFPENCTMGVYGFEVEPTYISPPTMRDIPRTDSIADFDSVVRGDLGEPVVGVTVNFDLTRRSTKDETLTITGGIGTTSTLARIPIDVMGDGTPELAITADGVLLALTTDYTVNPTTGVITWVTSQSGKVVKATYSHRATATKPAFGTLLTSQAVTDQDGRATTQVAYGTDTSIVGQLDALEANFE